jgi:hypothetical protein
MEKFDPRNPETYQYATNNPLVIDGVKIFNTYGGDDEIKEPESENSFVTVLSFLIKSSQRQDPNFHVQEYIDNYVQRKMDECSPMPKKVKNAGGYGFTKAQLEVLGEISDSDLENIGKTMSSGKRGGKLKQALFNAHGSLNRDWHYLTELCDQNEAGEKKVMLDYFLYDNGRFETEEEVHEYFDNSEYLKKHPKMKKELVESALDSIKESKEAEERLSKIIEQAIDSVNIDSFKNKILSSQEAKAVKGSSLIPESVQNELIFK